MEIKINPLHLACMDDELRPNFALIEINNNIASATNGHMIVRLDLYKHGFFDDDTLKILNGKHIHMEAWKEMHKCDLLQIDEAGMHITKNGITKHIDFSEPNGEFFKIQTVIDGIKLEGEKQIGSIGLCAKFIDDIRKIFKTDNIQISFSGANRGMVIMPNGDDASWAMLMPVMQTEYNRYFI